MRHLAATIFSSVLMSGFITFSHAGECAQGHNLFGRADPESKAHFLQLCEGPPTPDACTRYVDGPTMSQGEYTFQPRQLKNRCSYKIVVLKKSCVNGHTGNWQSYTIWPGHTLGISMLDWQSGDHNWHTELYECRALQQ